MFKCSFGLDAYLTVNTVSLNLYWCYAAFSISTRTSQRKQCLATYTYAQLFLPSKRVPHSENSVSQPTTYAQLFLLSQRVPHSAHILSTCNDAQLFLRSLCVPKQRKQSQLTATTATRKASLLTMAIGVTHPLTSAPTQPLTLGQAFPLAVLSVAACGHNTEHKTYLFSTTLAGNFLILRKIQRDIVVNVHRSWCKVAVILVRF
jgi:hypothetical protein